MLIVPVLGIPRARIWIDGGLAGVAIVGFRVVLGFG